MRAKLLVLFFLLFVAACNNGIHEEGSYRDSAVAGTFYPRYNLGKVIDSYLSAVSERNTNEDLIGIVSPHAGYKFSGKTAAYGYSTLPKGKVFIILAPSHYENFKGISIINYSYYKTPLGLVKVYVPENLKKLAIFSPHKKEHSIEVQLPFLQRTHSDFVVVPILVGSISNEYADKVAKAIYDDFSDRLGKDAFIILSSDFTHYGKNYGYVPFTDNIIENLRKLNNLAIDSLNNSTFDEYIATTSNTICGYYPFKVLMALKKYLPFKIVKFHESSSNDVTHNINSVVWYYSLGIYLDKKKILHDTAIKGIKGEKVDYIFKEKKGCFVTLKENGRLRGCIGTIMPIMPLSECVEKNAYNAAYNDPRFPPISENESFDIEISILSVPKELKYGDDLLDKINSSIGIILTKGFHKATFLPQVWEDIPDKERFLSALCLKAGLEEDCYKDHPKIEYYTAEVI